MRKEQVIGIGMGGLQTISGWKQIVGNAHKQAGDIVWVDGNFAMVGQQRYSSRRPVPIPQESSIILIASTDGQYTLINKDDFSFISSGTFKHWPTDFISNLGYTTNRVAYNGNYAVVLVSATSYDDNWNEIATFTCFDLTTGNQLFSTTGYDIINSCGFYLEVSDSGSVSFGGIGQTYFNLGNGGDSIFVSQVCIDGVMSNTIVTKDSLASDTSPVEEAIQQLDDIRNVNMNRRTAPIRNNGFGGVCAAVLIADDGPGSTIELASSASIDINVTIPAEHSDISTYLSNVFIGNVKTGEFIGSVSYNTGQVVEITGRVYASLINMGISRSVYRIPSFFNNFTDSYGNPDGYPIWPELYLPDGYFSDGLWDFPQTIDSPVFGDWNPDTFDAVASNNIEAQNLIHALKDFPSSGDYEGQVILHWDYIYSNSAGLNWYIWKNGNWQYNGIAPQWGYYVDTNADYAYTPLGNNGYCVEPHMRPPIISNAVGTPIVQGTEISYEGCQSIDIDLSTSEFAGVNVLYAANIDNISNRVEINKQQTISAEETYFPVSVICEGESQPDGNIRAYLHIGETVTWGNITYGEELGYGSGAVSITNTIAIEKQSITTAYSTNNHDVSVYMDADGTTGLTIDGNDVSDRKIDPYAAYAGTDYKNSSGQSVFLMVCSYQGLLAKIGSGDIQEIDPVTSFEVGSTQIGLVTKSGLLGKI